MNTNPRSQSGDKVRTAVFISGRGSNMMALVEAAAATDYPAQISLVLSNRPDAAGLAWAAERGIATAVVDHKAFSDREAFEAAIDQALAPHRIELIALAGFMRILTASFVTRWHGRLINIHPSLLPAYKGLHTHARAIDAGECQGGCSVHFVEPEMDAGPVIVQAAVPITAAETPESLATRVLSAEHRIYPLALAWVASGAVQLTNARIRVSDDFYVPPSLIVPALAG